MKTLSIVIPVYNNWNFTKACLDDLSYLPNTHEIIVIDNSSETTTFNNLNSSSEIVYKKLKDNMGFGYAVNEGFSIASGLNLMTLNNDIRVKADKSNWTSYILNECNNGLVSPTMGLLDNQFSFIKEVNYTLDSGLTYLSGWCLASSKDNFNKLILSEKDSHKEFFDERFFVYFEDTDLSFRAKQLGIKLIVQNIPVVHFGKQTSKTLNTYKLYIDSKKIFEEKWR